MNIPAAIKAIEAFQGTSLTKSLSAIEHGMIRCGQKESSSSCASLRIDESFLASALAIKKVAGQINVIIHAAGILHSLPHILQPGEIIESISLGAGNTGRKFDLETNYRIAEYKFIDWQGGSESIRQNGIFKDFYELAEHETCKRKYLYVIGTAYPTKFLNGGRALARVLSRYPAILSRISEKYGVDIRKVSDYYQQKRHDVVICDVSPYIGRL